ncbi:hypothetical protein DN402_15660 [Streptomyces sp. SW4]|nr:hypothetical protein DN402_15660 [Streptomyces sp. SW4]
MGVADHDRPAPAAERRGVLGGRPRLPGITDVRTNAQSPAQLLRFEPVPRVRSLWLYQVTDLAGAEGLPAVFPALTRLSLTRARGYELSPQHPELVRLRAAQPQVRISFHDPAAAAADARGLV